MGAGGKTGHDRGRARSGREIVHLKAETSRNSGEKGWEVERTGYEKRKSLASVRPGSYCRMIFL